MLKKIIIVIPIIIAVVGFILSSESNNTTKTDNVIFHITLANPEIYQDGKFTDTFSLEAGEYFFRFVPNGDSPKSLSISLKGDNFNFSENFRLNGTSHETGISQYYTWDYDGEKEIIVSEKQNVTIQINPNGNLVGTVSVDITQN